MFVCRYEEKAQKQLEHHEQRSRSAAEANGERGRGLKRKAPPPSNQRLLDELFSAEPQQKSRAAAAPRPSLTLPCSVASLRRRLQRLSSQSGGAQRRGLRLVKRLASQSAWLVLCGRSLALLNPFRVEEALLFKRLVESNILPAAPLHRPILLTDG